VPLSQQHMGGTVSVDQSTHTHTHPRHTYRCSLRWMCFPYAVLLLLLLLLLLRLGLVVRQVLVVVRAGVEVHAGWAWRSHPHMCVVLRPHQRRVCMPLLWLAPSGLRCMPYRCAGLLSGGLAASGSPPHFLVMEPTTHPCNHATSMSTSVYHTL